AAMWGVGGGGGGCSAKRDSPSPPAVNEPQNDQENDGTDGGHDDGRNDAGAEVDAQLGQQPAADEGADDADADVRDEAVTGAFDDLSGKPSRDQADQQNDENRFIRHAHFLPFGDTAHRGRRPQSAHHTERVAARPAAAARRPHDALSWWLSRRGRRGRGNAWAAAQALEEGASLRVLTPAQHAARNS